LNVRYPLLRLRDPWETRIRKINHGIRRGEHFVAAGSIERFKKRLPQRISEIRGNRSQRQFARELGVFQQNVHRYESGTTPHADFLITLALRENISLDWLLLGKGKMRRTR
jgi:transcriptional regulator with XRE-family HTH domain